MELIYANDNCTGCNKCVRDCPVLIANVATDAGKVTVDSEKCIACGACFDACEHNAREYQDGDDAVRLQPLRRAPDRDRHRARLPHRR